MPIDLRGASCMGQECDIHLTLNIRDLNDDNKICQKPVGVCLARVAELQVLGGL